PEAEKRVIRDACFVAIKQEAGYEQVRAIIRQMSQNLPNVLSRLREKKPKMFPARSAGTKKKEKSKTLDPLRTLAKEEPAENAGAAEDVGSVVADINKLAEVAPVLFEV